ncbi:tetratricopeptide repeat protein [Thalassobaculum sp. OXR-137]|uniref:tetratricopeptide repeat protein n=1 Tax=Thalassobaculum sp. OXR-137 TaxID=3100173 RepID=UPI002AC9D7B7|nr:tetratricopeptide repeat protein [Thalassobaculum sp. OXR-137]WPZ34177.1 tetratricopeptide repeat protein [Thalassobaculum sp. OXR-137]
MTGASLTADRLETLTTLFHRAVRLHSDGHVRAAAQAYDRILRDLPDHPDALDLYGTALFQLGAPEAGRLHVLASLRHRLLHGPAWNHLGAIDRALQDQAAAQRAFLRSILVAPQRAEAWINLAAVLGDVGEAVRGLRVNRCALLISPRSADADLRQRILLARAEAPAEAIPILDAAWARHPGNGEVAQALARAQIALGRLAEARRVVMAAIVLVPETHEFYGSLALTHDPGHATERDIAWARAATRLRPLDPRSWINLCAETYRDGRNEDALMASRRALLLDPASPMGLHNLAAAEIGQNRTAVCRRICGHALCVRPGDAEVLYTLAEVEFRIGDARTAWRLHEARLCRAAHRPRLNLPPPWRGPGTETGPLLVASEQGVGDEVTFLSCLAEIWEEIRQPVVIEVDSRLTSLIARTFRSATVVPRQSAPSDGLGGTVDYAPLTKRFGLRHHIMSGSLPYILNRGRDRSLARVGYLRTDPDRVTHWRRWLSSLGGGTKVGVVWRTVHLTRLRARSHCSIEDVLPVFATPDCRFVNLMAGDTDDEVARVRAVTGVDLVTPPDLDIWDGLDDLAALMQALDVVVAARTANCAFAGAVGTPTIRLAQGFMRISNDREFFFPNVYPVFDRDEAFNGAEAGRRAAAMLRKHAPRAPRRAV